jgi:hypothetical protein
MSTIQLTINPSITNIKLLTSVFTDGDCDINQDKNKSIILSCLELKCKNEFESLIKLINFNSSFNYSLADQIIACIIENSLENSYAEILIQTLKDQQIGDEYNNYFIRDLPYLVKALECGNFELFTILYRGKNYLEVSPYFLHQPKDSHRYLTMQSANRACSMLIKACPKEDMLLQLLNFIEEYKLADVKEIYSEFSADILINSSMEVWLTHIAQLNNVVYFSKEVKVSLLNVLAHNNVPFHVLSKDNEFNPNLVMNDVPMSDKVFEVLLGDANTVNEIALICRSVDENDPLYFNINSKEFIARLLQSSSSFCEKYLAYINKYSVSFFYYIILLEAGKMTKPMAEYSLGRLFIDDLGNSNCYDWLKEQINYTKLLIDNKFINSLKADITTYSLRNFFNYLINYNNDLLISLIKDGVIVANEELIDVISLIKKSSKKLQAKILTLME